ncbi:MAG: B12-binding domain-containing radical SAM protein [Acidobacteria bacterium]|nr:B12-binding domain-containing radical SAM protein [Acidobacteriota bacterium]
MKVKMILPALTEAKSPFWRPIKYSLFPPLGLATLASYLDPDDDISICDEHVENIRMNDRPDLVVIQAYVTSAYRAYKIADFYRRQGSYVCLGGLHVTSMPEEAAKHADTVFLGPGEDTWPEFLKDYGTGHPRKIYTSTKRSLHRLPFPRRDLLRRRLYLVPNSIVVSRGCPYQCDFCYQTSFFRNGRSFYTLAVDRALSEIDSLPGKHLYFLDDNFFGDPAFTLRLLDGLHGMGRLWQAAGTVASCLSPGLIEKAARCGLRSLFIGFETLDTDNLRTQHKFHNIDRDYRLAVRRLHDAGVMVNASFVFGLDGDGPDVFDRTVEWAVEQGIETATFHILTPYPDTPLFGFLQREKRLTSLDWDRYDTRHAVFSPAKMSAVQLEAGYRRAYREFYSWANIFRTTVQQKTLPYILRHFAFKAAWKKFEPFWDLVVRLKSVSAFTPMVETVLSGSTGSDFDEKRPSVVETVPQEE